MLLILKKTSNKQTGASMVEMALVLLIFMALCAAMLDFSVLILRRALVDYATYYAARAAAIAAPNYAEANNEYDQLREVFTPLFLPAQNFTTLAAEAHGAVCYVRVRNEVEMNSLVLGKIYYKYSATSFYPIQVNNPRLC